MNEVLVSVVVPIFNAQNYLSRCIHSILSQTYSNIELILVNDGSTDQSQSIIESFLIKDQRIKYISQVNAGPSVARNKGIAEATGEFICFIDADDVVPNHYIQLLVEKISQGYDVVACGYVEISEYGRFELNDFYHGKDSLTKDEFINGILKGVGGTLWAKIYRRSIIDSNQLHLNPNIYMCEDLLFNLDYCRYTQQFAAIKLSLYEYNRLNEGSITSKVTLNYLENNLIVMKEMGQLLQLLRWDNQKIEGLMKERTISLTLSIASNESANLMRTGMTHCCNQLECLINYPFVQKYLDGYHPNKQIFDSGGYYLKQGRLKCSVISFFITEQLRYFKRWITKRNLRMFVKKRF